MVFGLNYALIINYKTISISGKKYIINDISLINFLIEQRKSIWIEIFLEYKGLDLIIPKTKKNGINYCKHHAVKWVQFIDANGNLTYKDEKTGTVHPYFSRSSEYVKRKGLPTGIVKLKEHK